MEAATFGVPCFSCRSGYLRALFKGEERANAVGYSAWLTVELVERQLTTDVLAVELVEFRLPKLQQQRHCWNIVCHDYGSIGNSGTWSRR